MKINIAVIGLGGTHHHDNEVGSAVVRRLRDFAPDNVTIRESSGDPLELGEELAGADLAILVDACCTGAPPGTVHRLDASERPGGNDWFPHYSTHCAGLADSLRLNQMLDTAPKRVLLFCVEGCDYSGGDGLTPSVEAAVDKVVDMVLAEVGSLALDPVG